jgi:hypothetical protein
MYIIEVSREKITELTNRVRELEALVASEASLDNAFALIEVINELPAEIPMLPSGSEYTYVQGF